MSRVRWTHTILAVGAPLMLLSAEAGAQGGMVNSRPIRPAEQAFIDRVTAEFAKILPPLPAGWTEVERKLFDAGGTVSDWDAPVQADYEWQIVVSDIEARQKKVDARQEAAAAAGKDAFEAAAARTQKLMEEFSTKLEAAMKRNDQAAATKLQQEFEKTMADAAKAAPPIVAAPELSDSYARIRVMVNPYSAPVAAEKKLPAPPSFAWAGRSEPDANHADREGVTRYLIGNWQPDGSGGHTLKFTPNKQGIAYGIVVEIEARADRAEALFRAMNSVRLKALLQ